VDVLVNNVGTFFVKPFTEFTAEDLRSLVSVNIEGFLFITQLAIKQMLERKSGGSIVNVTTSLVGQPIAGVNASVPMITKGGIDAVTRSLALEYAKNDIRVNAVAPGIVDTPLHKDDPKDFLRTLQPMGRISDVKDIVDAIVYLSEAPQVTGEVLHVDGAHAADGSCRWHGRRAPNSDCRSSASIAGTAERSESTSIGSKRRPSFPDRHVAYGGSQRQLHRAASARSSMSRGYQAARLATLNALAVTREHPGTLDRVSASSASA
jgi:hypothetical protein